MRNTFLLAGWLFAAPASAQGVIPAAEGTWWGLVGGLAPALFTRPLVDKVADCPPTRNNIPGGACSAAVGVVLTGFMATGAYLGASSKERLPSMRRGAWKGLLLGAAVGTVVAAATNDIWNSVGIQLIGMSAGVVIGALSFKAEPAAVDRHAPAIIPLAAIRF